MTWYSNETDIKKRNVDKTLERKSQLLDELNIQYANMGGKIKTVDNQRITLS